MKSQKQEELYLEPTFHLSVSTHRDASVVIWHNEMGDLKSAPRAESQTPIANHLPDLPTRKLRIPAFLVLMSALSL